MGKKLPATLLILGSLLVACGEDDDKKQTEPVAKAIESMKTTPPETGEQTPPAPTEPDVPDGPSPEEIAEQEEFERALDYSKRVKKFNQKYRSQNKTLEREIKRATSPAGFIAAAKKYKRYLNRTAHTLRKMKPPPQVRTYHHRMVTLVRRANGHVSIVIGGVRQLNLEKIRKFETLFNRDVVKIEKATDTINTRMRRLYKDLPAGG
jgi:hypothetical protein